MSAPNVWTQLLTIGVNAHLQNEQNDRAEQTARARAELAALQSQTLGLTRAQTVRTALYVGGFVAAVFLFTQVRKRRKAKS